MNRTNAWQGDDFPSWLSPMIVKELRQGVQSGAFTWTFICLQVVMFLVMSWAFLALGDTGPDWAAVRTSVTGMFWFSIAVAVVVVLPLRALGSISGEQAGNNLDLVRLTRLSATKIVLGKWLAVVSQVALVVTALLPYIVLRHFFGAVNVLHDLETVSWLFVTSMLVAAGALALSTQPVRTRIAAVLLALLPSIYILEGGMFRGASSLGAAGRVGVLAVMAIYTAFCLEYAASRIAPVAENHAARKRGLALLVAGGWLGAGLVATHATAAWIFVATAPLLLVAAVEALLETPVFVRSQAAAFARRGAIGRLAARVLSPGWPSGLVFVVLVAAIAGAGLTASIERFTPRDAPTYVAALLLLVAAVVFPLPLLLLLPRTRHRTLLYAIVHLVCFLLFVYTQSLKPRGVPLADWPIGWMGMLPFPAAALGALAACGTRHAAAFMTAGLMVTAITLLIVARQWLQEWRRLDRLLAACRPRPATAAAKASPNA